MKQLCSERAILSGYFFFDVFDIGTAPENLKQKEKLRIKASKP